MFLDMHSKSIIIFLKNLKKILIMDVFQIDVVEP